MVPKYDKFGRVRYEFTPDESCKLEVICKELKEMFHAESYGVVIPDGIGEIECSIRLYGCPGSKEDAHLNEDVFRKDIIPYQKMKDMKPESEWTEEDWKKVCPEYGKGFSHMSGLYCDHCTSLYDKNRKLCPNNH